MLLRLNLQVKSEAIIAHIRRTIGFQQRCTIYSYSSEEGSPQADDEAKGCYNDSERRAKLRAELVKLDNLLPKAVFPVGLHAQLPTSEQHNEQLLSIYEDLANDLLPSGEASGDTLLSFEFYVLSGRFSIQQILDAYLDPLLSDLTQLSAAAIVTACTTKFVEAGVLKTDVIILFAAYVLQIIFSP